MSDLIKYLWVGIMILPGINAYSQVVDLNTVSEADLVMFWSARQNVSKVSLTDTNTKGSPYYNDEFITSDVIFKNGESAKEIAVRLNLYNKSIEFQRGEEVFEMVGMEDLKHVKLGEEYFKLIYLNNELVAEGFYKIEVNGKYKLLKSLQVVFKYAKKARTSYEQDKPAEFRRLKEKYYLQIENNAPVAFGNKKNFKKVFGTSFPEFVQYANDNKINPARFEDLVKMVQHFNSLK